MSWSPVYAVTRIPAQRQGLGFWGRPSSFLKPRPRSKSSCASNRKARAQRRPRKTLKNIGVQPLFPILTWRSTAGVQRRFAVSTHAVDLRGVSTCDVTTRRARKLKTSTPRPFENGERTQHEPDPRGARTRRNRRKRPLRHFRTPRNRASGHLGPLGQAVRLASLWRSRGSPTGLPPTTRTRSHPRSFVD